MLCICCNCEAHCQSHRRLYAMFDRSMYLSLEAMNFVHLICPKMIRVFFETKIGLKCFKHLEQRMHWKHLKHLDDDLKAIVVLWNLYRWKRVSWAFNEALEKQDVEEIVRRCSMPRPIFKMLDHDDYSTKSLKLRWFPRYTRDDIRRECCGWYGVTRGEEYLTAIE